MIKKIINIQFAKFLLTGMLNTSFGYLAFSFFTYVTGNPSLSVILANITGVLFNFKSYGLLVFKSHDNSRIYRFSFAYTILTISQIGLLKFLEHLGLHNAYIAAAILTPPMAIFSYVLLTRFVFREPSHSPKNN